MMRQTNPIRMKTSIVKNNLKKQRK